MERQSFIGPLSEEELERLAKVRKSALEMDFGPIEESDSELQVVLVEIDQIGYMCSPEGAADLTSVSKDEVHEDWFMGLVNDGARTGFTEIYRLPSGQFVKVESIN